MATRATNTMTEGLQSLLGDVSSMKALPDADLAYLTELETFILKKLREPVDAMAGQLGNPPPGLPGMGVPGPAPSLPPGVPGGPPGGIPVGAGSPNPDELRRVLANVQG